MKERADVLLTELGLAQSREKARSLIMAGAVYAGEVRVEKPGDMLLSDAELTVREDPNPFVSRGGLKLDKAIKAFDITLDGAVAADIGASTGGFTDCMLKRGATKVYAIDVGYGQLDWRLRNDSRVIVMERTNARNIAPDWFIAPLNFASIDVSFISVKLILPGLFDCLDADGAAVVLVKPQFEAGRGKVGKNGVVRDKSVHSEVILSTGGAALDMGYSILGLDYSPITGPKGNIEFLLYLSKRPAAFELASNVKSVVDAAHGELDR